MVGDMKLVGSDGDPTDTTWAYSPVKRFDYQLALPTYRRIGKTSTAYKILTRENGTFLEARIPSDNARVSLIPLVCKCRAGSGRNPCT
jgi:hypothetical protein